MVARVIGLGAMRAQIIIVVFTIGVFYASFCTTACAVEGCPTLAQHAANHDCDHPDPQHSKSSHNHEPGNSDCHAHGHPSFAFQSSTGVQLHLGAISHCHVELLFLDSRDVAAVSLDPVWGSGLAPPLSPYNPTYQQFSVLRI